MEAHAETENKSVSTDSSKDAKSKDDKIEDDSSAKTNQSK